MACIITYKNNKYSQQEFEKYFKNNFNEFVNEFLTQDIEGFKEFVNKENVQKDYNNLNFNNPEVLKYLYERSSKSKDFTTFANDIISYVTLTQSTLSTEEIIEKLNCL